MHTCQGPLKTVKLWHLLYAASLIKCLACKPGRPVRVTPVRQEDKAGSANLASVPAWEALFLI